MKCPRCEEGIIKKVVFKKNKRQGYLCDFCGTVWIGKEEINSHTGHPFDAISQGDAVEFNIEEGEEMDQEHRDVLYQKNK